MISQLFVLFIFLFLALSERVQFPRGQARKVLTSSMRSRFPGAGITSSHNAFATKTQNSFSSVPTIPRRDFALNRKINIRNDWCPQNFPRSFHNEDHHNYEKPLFGPDGQSNALSFTVGILVSAGLYFGLESQMATDEMSVLQERFNVELHNKNLIGNQVKLYDLTTEELQNAFKFFMKNRVISMSFVYTQLMNPTHETDAYAIRIKQGDRPLVALALVDDAKELVLVGSLLPGTGALAIAGAVLNNIAPDQSFVVIEEIADDGSGKLFKYYTSMGFQPWDCPCQDLNDQNISGSKKCWKASRVQVVESVLDTAERTKRFEIEDVKEAQAKLGQRLQKKKSRFPLRFR